MPRTLITSALPYINGVKHLGNLAGSMLPADVYARQRRLAGHEVLYVCATDEHGTPAELAAAKEGVDVRAYCDAQHALQRQTGDGFGLSYDWFGRSSSPQNHRLTQHFALALEAAGLIEERTSRQIYAVEDGRFLPDRYVEGTCPHCAHRPARGDQCDNCGRLLDPVDLIEPYSAVTGSSAIEVRETNHLFLLQSKMQERMRAWVEASSNWPSLARSIAMKWIDEGLHDRAITRDLSWGVPVVTADGSVRPGFENKVFYVWFDAPIEYIAATAEWAQDALNDPDASEAAWKRWWRDDAGAQDVTYVQFMGKDNVAFHAVSFPVTLIGSGEPWTLVDQLKAFNWLTWYGGKFSTSQGRGVFMDQALEILPSDVWRWHLTANAPEGSDTPFTFEHLQAGTNADLANVFGNLINRITKFASSKLDGVVPATGAYDALEAALLADFDASLERLNAAYEAMEFRKAAAETRAIWARGNEYLQTAAPWTALKTDPELAGARVRAGLNYAALCAIVAQPIIPDAAGKVLDALGVPGANRAWPSRGDAALLDALPHGLAIHAPDVLFAKIEDADVEAWRARFGAEADEPEQA